MAFQGGINIGDSEGMNAIFGLSQDAIERQLKEIQDIAKKMGINTIDATSAYQKKLDADRRKDEREDKKKLYQLEAQYGEDIATRVNAKLKLGFAEAGKQLADAVGRAINAAGKSIDSYIDTYSRYMGTIESRIQGSGKTYNELMRTVSTNLAASPYVKQSDMLANINKYVESGITYNLELRSFIASTSDKIAATFNAFDSSLMRIIRIQQADSTVARLGMEATLTQFLQGMFQDTSYLTESASSVRGSLLGAESQMGLSGATEFEYVVNKWLGSMQGVGVSSGTIQSLAAGLGQLGSGDVSGLAGTPLEKLLVMAAGRKGLNYGSLLTGGLDARSANALLAGIVEYTQEIANTGNKVVKSQYANLFGMTIADMTAILNLSSQDLVSISKNMLTYSDAIAETENQLANLDKRTTISERVRNVLDNYMTTLGQSVATNPTAYAIWQVASMLESSGINPTINMGFLGSGTSATTSSLMKTGVIGLSALTSLPAVLGGLSTSGGTNLSMWGWDGKGNIRGSGLTAGMTSGPSVSASATLGGSLSTEEFQSGGYEETVQQSKVYQGEEKETSAEMYNIIKESIDVNIQNIYNLLMTWNSNSILGFRNA